MGINKVNKLYNIAVSSNIFHLQPELCKSVHKCIFGEFLKFFPGQEASSFYTGEMSLSPRVQPHVAR